jgi:alcohol dehydrogenase YqhD (iron-dependent ADH family)
MYLKDILQKQLMLSRPIELSEGTLRTVIRNAKILMEDPENYAAVRKLCGLIRSLIMVF